MNGRLVELAGPAGSGKTTLATALRALDPATRVGLPAGRGAVTAALVGASPTLVRARAAAPGRWWTAAELRAVGYLSAWQRPAGRPRTGTTLLDHGPAFRLASLLVSGPPMVRTRPFHRWWSHTCVAWGLLLDTVVWLDAPDEVLIGRIRARDRDHRVRASSLEEAVDFLDSYREGYDATLDVLRRTGTRVLRLDTSTASPDELAAALAPLLAPRTAFAPGPATRPAPGPATGTVPVAPATGPAR